MKEQKKLLSVSYLQKHFLELSSVLRGHPDLTVPTEHLLPLVQNGASSTSEGLVSAPSSHSQLHYPERELEMDQNYSSHYEIVTHAAATRLYVLVFVRICSASHSA